MKSKKESYAGTPPGCARHTLEDTEEKDRTDDVENNVAQVVKAAPQAEELTVGHMRKPSQRYPIGRVSSAKCPH
jgi:hypothetical protein